MASAVVSSQPGNRAVVCSIVQQVKKEICGLCSMERETVLRDSIEAVKFFSWETIWLELEHCIPTLMTLLKLLVKHPGCNKPLLCFLASMLLKQRSPKLSLVQKAISILMYGNGTSKEVSTSYLYDEVIVFYTFGFFFYFHVQVYRCLQPLMVCLSSSGTAKLIERLNEDHDIEVQFWADDMKDALEVQSYIVCSINTIKSTSM